MSGQKKERGTQLAGKSIVVTGTLQNYKREDIEGLIVQLGGKATGSFHAVLGVPAFTVLNVSTGLPRRVFLPPNGVARIQL